MARDQSSTPFAVHANEPVQVLYEKDVVGSGANVTAGQQSSMPSAKSYQLVKSATGNVYVEPKAYDPLEHHRKRDAEHSKGQGLGFMFCCFSQPATREVERAGYELEPTNSSTTKQD
eukprot:GHRQ01027263.1.p1 GENE.GHRQ01027263.1~~GHRQ01027263.1.p1  ORF type:complete len:117 (+),score=31.41 GHRQ01027263.1:72-422(+)